jgi:hypothetical protein
LEKAELLTSNHVPVRRQLARYALCVSMAIGLHTATVAPAQASTSCSAVNAGAFNLTNTTLGASSSSILFGWAVGDQITLTLTSSDGASRTDGFYHGSTFAAGTFGPLQTVTVPATGNVQTTHTVVSADLTSGIAVDPENNDSVTATCTAAPAPAVTSISPSTGPAGGGTSVTITGTGFINVNAVSFGPNGATVVVNSVSQITATAPSGSGTVDVIVTTNAGTSPTSSADQYTYIPAPTVTSVSPSVGRTAGGASVTIGGANLNGATVVSFGGVSATINTDTASSITATAPAHGSGTVDVTVTTPGGTSAISAADHFTYFATPTVTSVSPTSGTTAGGTSVTVAGTNLNGATAVSFGGAAASITANSGSAITARTPAHSAGLVDVTVTTPGGTSATSSADQFTFQVPPLQTWVSALGSDSNDCSRAAPCLTFAAALAQTSAGGEIDVLDPGDFGPVTITKAVSIYNDAMGDAGVTTAPGTSGIIISAGANDVIHLRGLIFDGATASGTSGIVFNSGADLLIENCVMQGFTLAGITFSPGAGSANTTRMTAQATTIVGNGAGILVKPSGGISANVSLTRVRIDNNTGGGLRVDGTGGAAAINLAIGDSSVSFNASNGINAVSAPGNVTVDVSRTTIASNGSAGIQSNQSRGATASVTVGNSQLRGNNIAAESVGGGSLFSYGNNQVSGNGTNGTFTGTAGLQ